MSFLEQLQFLAFIFKAFYSHAKKLISPLVTVGVFWDYLSLPQPSLKASLEEPFVDDRTPEERQTFEQVSSAAIEPRVMSDAAANTKGARPTSRRRRVSSQ